MDLSIFLGIGSLLGFFDFEVFWWELLTGDDGVGFRGDLHFHPFQYPLNTIHTYDPS